VLQFLKAVGGPGSIGFLAMCCAIGLGLRAAGAARAGRAWLLSVYIAYVFAGLPIVAKAVQIWLPADRPVADPGVFAGADALIVLHGDNVRGRVREAVRILSAANPPALLVSGDSDFVDLLVHAGLPRDRLVVESTSTNTREQVQFVARFVRERQIQKPVLVASRLQTPRIGALLRRADVRPVLAPSEIDDEPPVQGVMLWVPMYKALRVTRDGFYELLALRYYNRQGWIEWP
jgi:uncharacterized SAM-binding protein YcdF (DUF218 family)